MYSAMMPFAAIPTANTALLEYPFAIIGDAFYYSDHTRAIKSMVRTKSQN